MDLLERILDPLKPPFIVAEMSGNHGGSIDKAIRLLVEAKKAGADALKLQTYKPETITVAGTDERFRIKSGLWKGKLLHQLYEEAMTPWEWHPILAKKADEMGLICFSSPFDETAVEFLEKSIDPPLYKVASFELNHYPMLERIGATGKPVVASTGVSSKIEIDRALEILIDSGCPQIILLYCVSEYPASPSEFCLQAMARLKSDHGVEFGLSDHSLGHIVPVSATALGARIIEKHFCVDRDKSSIDGAFSMLPNEFAEMVQSVHMTHQAVFGNKSKGNGSFFKRSILVSSPIQRGERLTADNLRIARPGDGICPSRWHEVLDGSATKDLHVGHPLCDDDFQLS